MRRGQLLVEVMIAIAVLVVALVGLVQVANKSVNNSGVSRRQAEATTYGSEAMQWVINQKNLEGWTSFVTHGSAGGTTYCFGVSPPVVSWPAAGGCGASPTPTLGNPVQFWREVRVTNNSAIEVGILATVSWKEGGRIQSSKQERTIGRY